MTIKKAAGAQYGRQSPEYTSVKGLRCRGGAQPGDLPGDLETRTLPEETGAVFDGAVIKLFRCGVENLSIMSNGRPSQWNGKGRFELKVFS